MKKYLLFCIYFFLLFPITAQAKIVTFEEKYTYDASEADSKLTSRAISLLQVKRLLLEKLGTYLESKTVVANYQLTKDEIISLSSGVIKTEIIDEIWDGKIYSLTAKVEVDPDAVAKSIDELRKNREAMEEIKKVENINENAIQKISQLKKELATYQNNLINLNRDYKESSKIVAAWDSYEIGIQFLRERKYREAVSALNKAMELNPTYLHFFKRGRAYMGMKKYRAAIDDFSTVIDLNPSVTSAYYYRGRSLRKIGEKKKGLDDIRKAAGLGNGHAKQWLKLYSK
jgi:tetratricopeptide (TPR) repeat protein